MKTMMDGRLACRKKQQHQSIEWFSLDKPKAFENCTKYFVQNESLQYGTDSCFDFILSFPIFLLLFCIYFIVAFSQICNTSTTIVFALSTEKAVRERAFIYFVFIILLVECVRVIVKINNNNRMKINNKMFVDARCNRNQIAMPIDTICFPFINNLLSFVWKKIKKNNLLH